MHWIFVSYCSDNCDFYFHFLGLLLLKKRKGKKPGRQTASPAGTAGELNCRLLPSINLTPYQTLSTVIKKIPSFYLYRVNSQLKTELSAGNHILKENNIWESTVKKSKIWLQGTELPSWYWIHMPLLTSAELQVQYRGLALWLE